MTLASLTAYAETHGVRKQSAAEWKSRGYLVMRGDKVDVEASDAKMEAAAKGRFRVKAHGGRRTTGERGLIDRPALGYVGGVTIELPAPPEPKPDPWKGWHRLGNPNTASDAMRELLAIGDEEAIGEMLDHLDFRDWGEASTMAGWDRWPSAAAASLAEELRISDVAKVEAALRRLVRERLATLDIDEADVTDPRLSPR
jgi:hypothetical protein